MTAPYTGQCLCGAVRYRVSVVFAPGAVQFETQPEDRSELVRLWKER